MLYPERKKGAWAPCVLIVAAMIFSAAAPAYANMKCPRGWARFSEDHRVGQPYFECDYTTRTCERGFILRNERTFELLAEDRQTVIGHYFCSSWRSSGYKASSRTCIDFDRGQIVLGQQSAVRQTTRRRLPRERCEGER